MIASANAYLSVICQMNDTFLLSSQKKQETSLAWKTKEVSFWPECL